MVLNLGTLREVWLPAAFGRLIARQTSGERLDLRTPEMDSRTNCIFCGRFGRLSLSSLA